jgi:1,2-dihydroxy-3-keto-5-methylthiopentene dioxygenase
MALLARFDDHGLWQDTWVCDDWVTRKLAAHGVHWGRWSLLNEAPASADAAHAAYAHEIAALRGLCDVRSAAWLGQHEAARSAGQPGPAEHRLADTEIRLVLAGAGLLYLRDGDGCLGLLCDAGEWVVLPADLPQAYDVGAGDALQVLRLSAGPVVAPVVPTGNTLIPPLTFDAFVEQVMELTGDVEA